jgi:hypothetical protein
MKAFGMEGFTKGQSRNFEQEVDRRTEAQRKTSRLLAIAGAQTAGNLVKREMRLQLRRYDAPKVEDAKTVFLR